MHSNGLSNRVDVCLSVCLSVCPWTKKIENSNNQLKYAVIRSKKGTITTFELFFEDHSAVSVIYDLW